MNAPQILPLTQDVKLLNSFLEKKRDECERQLSITPTVDNYVKLAKVVLALAIVFNRRREGEVSRMTLMAEIGLHYMKTWRSVSQNLNGRCASFSQELSSVGKGEERLQCFSNHQ